MPQLVEDKKLKQFVQRLGNKDYLTVAGRVFSSHNARQFVGLDYERWEDEKYFYVTAIVTIHNSHMEGYENFPPEYRFSTFKGTARSLKTGGKSAEGSNPIETAETSAVGRALGFAGFGVEQAIASFEEVEAALAIQAQQANQPTKAQKDEISKLLNTKDPAVIEAAVKEKFEKGLKELTKDDAEELLVELRAANVPF